MKKFENLAEDGQEKAIRRGNVVPPGAVNIAWAKSPSLSPKHNTIIIDTSRISGEGSNVSTKSQKLAYANYLGVLEDSTGNQVWDEEYPIVSEIFLPTRFQQKYGENLTEDDILPYVHVSRYFHVDFVGLANNGFEEFFGASIKVVDKNGTHYVDQDGTKKYKIYLAPHDSEYEQGSRDTTYRVHCFLDMNPDADELFLAYNKVEVTSGNVLRNQQVDYKEQINPRPHFSYTPEESDVLDYVASQSKIYSTKPINLKQKALNLPQSDHQGWRVHVPRKAVPDPRLFQLFRWRVACEYVQPVGPQDPTSDQYSTATTIKAGVIVPPGGNFQSTRANYLFYQLNTSDYNFSKVRFVNPLNDLGDSQAEETMQKATYWHVDIDSVSLDDLSKFDILVWAPTATAANIDPYRPKIDHFVEQQGGTFIFETSSFVGTATGLNGFTFSERMDNPAGPAKTDSVAAETVRFYDATPDNPLDEFSSYGGWKQWPPDVRDIITNYNDIGSILSDASPIAGWNLTTAEKTGVTPYDEVPNMRLQSITAWPTGFKKVLEGKYDGAASVYRPTLMAKRFDSGGNFFVSTGCIFEDHLFEPSGDLIMRTMQVADWNDLGNNWKMIWDPITSSFIAAAEFKLKYNVMMYATMFRPSASLVNPSNNALDFSNDNQTTTVYSDWFSSWVINPENGVLSDVEIDEFDFILQSVSSTDLEPTWQRILSGKTIGQIIAEKLVQIEEDNPGATQRLSSANKRYFMITTNPQVEVPPSDILDAEDIPRAWTTAYSPAFVVPYELGPYKVRDEMIAGTGVGDGRRIYPPKQWSVKPKLTYLKSSSETNSVVARVKLTATTKRFVKVKDELEWRKVWIPGVPKTTTKLVDAVLAWKPDGIDYEVNSPRKHQGGAPVPYDFQLDTWTDANYLIRGNNWPFWGASNTLSVNHPYGKVPTAPDVIGVQQFLNQQIFFGKLAGPYLKEDGYYGQTTRNKVLLYQQTMGAQYQDGVVDAETFGIIGYGLLALRSIPTWRANQGNSLLGQWSDFASITMRHRLMSDKSAAAENRYMRASWHTNGPDQISEVFKLALDPDHIYATGGKFHIIRVDILPLVSSTLNYLDYFTNGTKSLTGYNFKNAKPGTVAYGPTTNWIRVPTDIKASGLAFQLTSRAPANNINYSGNTFGTAKAIGVSDIQLVVKRKSLETIITDGYWQNQQFDPGTYHTIEITEDLTYEANITFQAGQVFSINAQNALTQQWKGLLAQLPADIVKNTTLKSVEWNLASIEFPDNPSLINYFDVTKRTINGAVVSDIVDLKFNGFGMTTSPASYSEGPWYGKGGTQYYTCTESRAVSPYPQRYGWVTKEEGIKLICDSTGKPAGFPYSIPNLTSENVHYANYQLEVDDTDQATYVGFWDNQRKEWVVNSAGRAVMSYYDYIRRGPNNVYIGAMTSYELDITGGLPNATDSINRPFKWAMPVYGVTTGSNSKIQLAPLNPDLSANDIWPIKIKTGTFSRTVNLKPRADGGYTGWIGNYQGSDIHAYYSVPESNEGPWSKLYGRPYIDIQAEQPLILDDNIIQVRQYPILSVNEPTSDPSLADPWRPVFQVSVRQSLAAPWVQVPLSDIRDFDLVKGIITLKENLPGNDSRLVKVDYTSEHKSFNLKWDGTNRINLNPYINPNKDWVDRPLYVYLVPEYVLDKDYRLIQDSVQTRTIKVTTDSTIFSPAQANYEPLSVMLGVVYITTSFDINELSLLDTRKRGGGVSVAHSDEDAIKIDSDAENFWDVISMNATTYQKGGFVIIRFPAEIAEYCTQEQVDAVIKRNIALGVEYKLETLDGESLVLPSQLDEEHV